MEMSKNVCGKLFCHGNLKYGHSLGKFTRAHKIWEPEEFTFAGGCTFAASPTRKQIMGVHPASYLLPGISPLPSLSERIAALNKLKSHHAQNG